MINILVISIITLLLNVVLNSYYLKHKDRYNKNIFSPNNIAVFSVFVASILSLSLTNLNEDMIINFKYLEIGFVIISLPLLLTLSYFYYDEKISKSKYCFAIILFSLALTFVLPEENLILNDRHSVWLDKLSIFSIILLSIYIFIYNDSYRLIQNLNYLIISTGIFIACLIGSVGIFIGAISFLLAINLLVSYAFEMKSPSSEIYNKAFNLPISFLIIWMYIRISGEEIWSLPISLSSYLIISFVFAIVSASFNLDKFWRNNNYNIANYLAKKSINFRGIISTHARSGFFIILLSLGSVYSSNPIGFLVIITIFTTWNLHKTINWEEKDKSIKEINKDFVNQLKENLNTTKEAIETITEKNDTENK